MTQRLFGETVLSTNSYWHIQSDLNKAYDQSAERSAPVKKEVQNIPEADCVVFYLLPENGLVSRIVLPVDPDGRHSFDDAENEKLRESLSIQAQAGKWVLQCIKPTYLLGDNEKAIRIVVIDKQSLIKIKNVDDEAVVFVDFLNDSAFAGKNYRLLRNKYTIGSGDECDIVYKNKYIDKVHAVLYIENGIWKINATGSNGYVYVNEKRVTDTYLKAGDVIYILGLKLIMGIGFISVNDAHPGVYIKDSHLLDMRSSSGLNLAGSFIAEKADSELFNRRPRRRLPMPDKVIKIELPPLTLSSESIPMLLRMGSPMVMGGASALSGNYLMLLTMVMFPFLNQKYSEKQKKEYEARRLEGYRAYLKSKRREIKDEIAEEERVLRENYPELNNLLSWHIDGDRLWGRRKTDDDFLTVRIGFGNLPMFAKLEYQEQRFSLDDDILEDEMYALATAPAILKDVPILVDFVENTVCSVSGIRQMTLSFAKRILMSMAVLNSYDEVKIVILADQEDITNELEFVKYIPHTWDDQKSIRYIATTSSEAYQIGEALNNELEKDLKENRELKEILRERPYYVVFALNKRLFDSMEVLKSVLQQEKNCGISIITVFEELPKECNLLFNTSSSGYNSIVYLKEISRENKSFKIDRFDPQMAKECMKTVANTNLKNISETYSLPKVLTFLEMFKAGRVEHLNVLTRWEENNPVKSLAAPIGVATDGGLFYLDLHQKFHGPHGLVAGTTGSGKSEFLITYILSMAINYRPDEVAFVLIDYKGGGLAGAFDDPVKGIHLPHLVGTITNLDGASIQRSLISIESELVRRQKVFNEAKSVSDEGTMDIYSYQKLYRSGKVSEPVPHLFIISDEFAELKQQQPEFMENLISAARIGRSLGVHLILATQKPAGVVNDQIRSNTKFRVCLKVQDKMDSMDMLQRTEAAEIKETGRFYLQVGYNEYFAMGQSGWAGAPYMPQDEVLVQKDESIRIIDYIGQTISEAKSEIKRGGEQGTQLVAIVKMLSDIAEARNIPVRMLWEPPLPDKIDISSLSLPVEAKDSVICPLALIDDPGNQDQFQLDYDFEKSQHLLIVGNPESGKTQLIQTILCSLTERYSPDEVQFLALDYSSRMLSKFKVLPHCMTVLLEEDESSLETFFEMIRAIITERKKLFSDIGADGFATAKSIKKLPLVLVVIDNVSGLSMTRTGERIAYELQSYLKDSLNYGVKFIVSCSRLNDMTSRNRQEFGDRICLHLNDKYEYSEALNCKVNYLPAEKPGRGLFNVEGRPLEFQAAIVHAFADDKERIADIQALIEKNKLKYSSYRKSRSMPVVDEKATYEDFANQFDKGRIPLGYSRLTNKPVALPLKQLLFMTVYIGNEAGESQILRNFCYAAKNEGMDTLFFTRNSDSKLEEIFLEGTYGSNVFTSKESAEQNVWEKLSETIIERRDQCIEYCNMKGISSDLDVLAKNCWKHMYLNTKPILIMIEDWGEFCMAQTLMTKMVYDKLFNALAGLNIYCIAFAHPDDPGEVRGDVLYHGMSTDNDIMLFGGRFNQQSFVEIPDGMHDPGQKLPFNVCLMKYKEHYNAMLMPCGESAMEDTDPDDEDIFK